MIKKRILRICAVWLLLCLMTLQPSVAFAAYESTAGLELQAESAYIKCLTNGQTIYSKNADTPRHPASMTKLVTAVIAVERCWDLEEIVEIKAETLQLLADKNASSAGLQAGEQLSLKNLLHFMLIVSAGDAGMAVADYVSGGDLPQFVSWMNALAEKLGCKHTHFENPIGLDADHHLTTCEDLAILAEYAFSDSRIRSIISLATYTVPATNLSPARVLYNTNKMLFKRYANYYNPYIVGGKTGSTSVSGRCVTLLAEKDGLQYLVIVMKAPYHAVYDQGGKEINLAFLDCKQLLEWMFTQLSLSAPIAQTELLTVQAGRRRKPLTVYSPEKLQLLLPKEISADAVSLEAECSLPGQTLQLPAKKGTPLGVCRVMHAGTELTSFELLLDHPVRRGAADLLSVGWVWAGIAVIMAACAAVWLGIRRKHRKQGEKTEE